MKDYLLDIVKHSSILSGNNGFQVIKVTGTETETRIESLSKDKSVVFKGRFKDVVPGFEGVFGIPNIAKLNAILNIAEYREDPLVQIDTQERNGVVCPVGFTITNSAGDFKNQYRFMLAEIVESQLKSIAFRGVDWDVEIDAVSLASVNRFKAQASAVGDESGTFVAKTDGGDLKFYFGEPSNNTGSFTFANDVSGSMTSNIKWPVSAFMSILNLSGDKTIKFNGGGLALITVDSGIGVYDYFITAESA